MFREHHRREPETKVPEAVKNLQFHKKNTALFDTFRNIYTT